MIEHEFKMASIEKKRKENLDKKERERERRRGQKRTLCISSFQEAAIEHLVDRTGSRDIIACRQSRLSVI